MWCGADVFIMAACQNHISSSSPFPSLRYGKSTLNKTPSGGWKVYLQRHILCISSSTFILIPLSVPLLLVCIFFAERGRKVKFRPLFCLFVPFFWPSPFVSGHSKNWLHSIIVSAVITHQTSHVLDVQWIMDVTRHHHTSSSLVTVTRYSNTTHDSHTRQTSHATRQTLCQATVWQYNG